jgi:hypothetical protein
MSTPSSDNPLWLEHLERLGRFHGQSPPETRYTGTRRIFMSDRDEEEARHGEWSLEFFAIAGAD